MFLLVSLSFLFFSLYLLQFSECAALYAIWPKYMTNIYVNKLEVISQHKLRSTPVGFVGVAVTAASEQPDRQRESEKDFVYFFFVLVSFKWNCVVHCFCV